MLRLLHVCYQVVFILKELPAAHFRLREIDLATRIPQQFWEGGTKPLGISANTDGCRLVLSAIRIDDARLAPEEAAPAACGPKARVHQPCR